MSAALEEALRLAQLGYFVVPCWPLDADRSCTCSPTPGHPKAGKDCPKPGKHPWNRHGFKDATTSEAGIRSWWAFRPDSGVGVNLEKSHLVDIAPDSPEWLATFQKRGLPPTASYQSGGGDANQHYWYLRPAGCPIERSCVPDQYDVMSEGLTVAPPSPHSSGRTRTWITPLTVPVDQLPEAPAWAVQMLAERATRNERAAAGTTDGDEPPVRLDESGLRRWRGELVETKPNGEIDRSDSLFEIGRVLAKANATARTIVAALEERDDTLGWQTYTDRRDDREYRRIANKVLIEPMVTYARPVAGGARSANGQSDADVQDESPPRDCGHQPIIDGLRATIRAMLSVYANEHLRAAEKSTAITAAFRLHERDSHGEPTLPGAAPPSKRVYLPKLAEELGQSAQTTSRHLSLVGTTDDAPYIKRTVDIDTPNGRRTVVELEPRHATLHETLAAVAAYAPPARPTHGGKRRPRCPEHPHAAVEERTSWTCAECGTVLDERASLHTDAPTGQATADVQDERPPTAGDPATRRAYATLCRPSLGVTVEGPLAAAADGLPDNVRPLLKCRRCRTWLTLAGECPKGCEVHQVNSPPPDDSGLWAGLTVAGGPS